MRPILKAISTACLGGIIAAGACNFDITNPNSPDQIGDNATPARVSAAVNGLIIAARVDATNWILKSSILSREGYRLDIADPRFVSELITATKLDPSNNAFGGGEWAFEYATIRSGYNIINVIGTAQLTDAQKEGVRGFTQTMQAYSYIILLAAHSEDSIPIDVNRPVAGPLAPFIANPAAWNHVASLLDSAQTHLLAAGSSFSFSLTPGFTGFSTPATFIQVNRALMAATQVYKGSLFGCTVCYDSALTALGASFVDTTASLDLGAYFDFSTNSGDITNSLSQDPTSTVNVVHPSIRDSVATKPGGGNDNRYTAKVAPRGSVLTLSGRSSDISWIRYPSPSSPVPIIRNEELILLRAEANNNATARDPVAAAADINFIRVNSGGLAADGTLSGGTQLAVQNEIMVQRKYSLLYEGHRWFDMRRTGRVNQIIIDLPGDNVFSTLPIPVFEVQPRQ